jgi:hypothetical protein
MKAINKESILHKTHYGLGIYAHILRQYYPDEIVLHLVERDCGLCRNPFNSNKKTLHIFIEKEKSCKREQSSNSFETMPSVADFAQSENILSNVYDKEFARHRDSENAIPAGDAFDFAELHYKQSGAELLQTLNKELNLRIGEQWSFYANAQKFVSYSETLKPQSPFSPLFSFFKAPITNIKPHKAVSLLQNYNSIKGDYYKARTEKLRAISDVVQARLFKAANFDYCTFSGVFTTRNDKALIKHSGLLCLDFDHLQSVEKLRFQLLQDEYFDTQLLFRSPSGNGLKWIISVDTTETTHGDFFAAVANYLKSTYNVEVDKSGKDISRACFLPYDPQAFINPIHLKKL